MVHLMLHRRVAVIGGELARHTLLKIINDNYTDSMGIEGYYAIYRAMEKDD